MPMGVEEEGGTEGVAEGVMVIVAANAVREREGQRGSGLILIRMREGRAGPDSTGFRTPLYRTGTGTVRTDWERVRPPGVRPADQNTSK